MNAPHTHHTMACGDQIFASLVCNGITIANIMKNNFGCLDEVLRYMVMQAGAWAGLASIKVRNASRGWSTNVTMTSPRHRMMM